MPPEAAPPVPIPGPDFDPPGVPRPPDPPGRGELWAIVWATVPPNPPPVEAQLYRDPAQLMDEKKRGGDVVEGRLGRGGWGSRTEIS